MFDFPVARHTQVSAQGRVYFAGSPARSVSLRRGSRRLRLYDESRPTKIATYEPLGMLEPAGGCSSSTIPSFV